MHFFKVLGLLVLLTSCAHNYKSHDSVYKSELSRKTASEKISEISASARLTILKNHTQALFDSIEKSGNPRFYLLENFLKNTNQIVESLMSSNSELMNQEVFVPEDKEIALKFTRLVASYQVMNKIGIYLSYNSLMPEEDELASQNFIQFDKAMSHYQDAIKNMALDSKIIKVEDTEDAYMSEQINLVHYLVSRIERHFESFVNNKKDIRVVESAIKKARSIKADGTFQDKIFKFKTNRDWKKVKKLFNNLELPESSSIDGMSESFEKVMSVQMCVTILDDLIEMIRSVN